MPRVVFTPNLRRHVACPDLRVEGTSLLEVLQATFEQQPQLRGYIVDDQFALRKHIAVFIGSRPALDRTGLSDEVASDAEVYVMQALSGG
ncbi:MAG: hypothetical protein R3B96_08950 [Pirellulaceae bacterium]